MFKKSRRRIVAAIMSILVILWVGSLGVIYASSYWEMQKQNEQMLRGHAQMYTLSPALGGSSPVRPMPGGDHGFNPGFDPESPKFQLSVFYTVAISDSGQILQIRNEPPTVHTDDYLTKLAKSIVNTGKETGKQDNLVFYKEYKGGYTLVVFMDNTLVNESAMMLFRYTLIFGGAVLILLFFLSVFLAKRIVKPLEVSYQKQKQFISDAGHELKTPVSVVSANAELLSRQIGENQWLSNIQYENERMGILVGQLLELARTENVTPQMENLDLSRLVAGEALLFESVAFEKGLSLNCDVAGGIHVEGNSTQLKQLTSILLDNAICHSNQKGQIRLTLKKQHTMAELSVINPGEEIPQPQRQQIFERFYRVDSARSGGDHHYGLGLAIAKAIADAHYGHIQVLCYQDQVEFRVHIPLIK